MAAIAVLFYEEGSVHYLEEGSVYPRITVGVVPHPNYAYPAFTLQLSVTRNQVIMPYSTPRFPDPHIFHVYYDTGIIVRALWIVSPLVNVPWRLIYWVGHTRHLVYDYVLETDAARNDNRSGIGVALRQRTKYPIVALCGASTEVHDSFTHELTALLTGVDFIWANDLLPAHVFVDCEDVRRFIDGPEPVDQTLPLFQRRLLLRRRLNNLIRNGDVDFDVVPREGIYFVDYLARVADADGVIRPFTNFWTYPTSALFLTNDINGVPCIWYPRIPY